MDAPRHLTDFRARDLEALLAAAGFQVVRRKYFSLRDNPAGLATSLAPSLDPMARRVRGVRETRAMQAAAKTLRISACWRPPFLSRFWKRRFKRDRRS